MKPTKTPILAALLALAVPAVASAHPAHGEPSRVERKARGDAEHARSADDARASPRVALPPPARHKKPPPVRSQKPPKPFYEGGMSDWTTENDKHMRRLAKLDRIEQIAASRADRRLMKRVRILRGQELARHKERLKELRRARVVAAHPGKMRARR